jgi:acetyl-CoA C-acetyltransferase
MGQTAENVARARERVPGAPGRVRLSARRTAEACASSGLLRARDHPSPCRRHGRHVTDDGIRAGTTLEGLQQLKPVFRPDGTVTAGNACPLNDGAAAVLVMSDTKAAELGLTPLARIVASGVSALNPRSWASGRSRRRARRSPAPA